MILGFEETNESFYEISWDVRAKLFDKIISRDTMDINGGIAAFLKMENECLFGLERNKLVPNDRSIPSRMIYTGKVDIQKLERVGSGYLEEVHDRVKCLEDVAARGFDAIVELGGGWGLNLFLLHNTLGSRIPRYILAEYTQAGRRLCEKFECLKGAPKLEKVFVDHKDLDMDFVGKVEKVLVFTCHSIEQVEFLPENYFRKICKAARQVVGIHQEPFGFQVVQDNDPMMNAHEEFIRQKGYNLNLYDRLKEAENSGILKILSVQLNQNAFQPENPTSVVIWEKC